MIEKPIRKYLKQKDYQKHKILRRIKKRNQRRKEAASKIAERALRKKLKLPAFDGGKDDEYPWYEEGVAPELVITPSENYFRTTADGRPAVSLATLRDAGIPVFYKKSKELKNNQKLLGHDEYLAQQAKVDEKVNKTTPSAELLFNIATIGGWNNLSPTQWARRVYDTGQLINGNMSLNEYMNKLYFGNNGIASDEYARKHPYGAMAANLVGDIATFGTTSALLKMPSWRRAMLTENQIAQDIVADNWKNITNNATTRSDYIPIGDNKYWFSSIPADENYAYRIMEPAEVDDLMAGNELRTAASNPKLEAIREQQKAALKEKRFSLFKSGLEHGGRKQFAKGEPWGTNNSGTTVTHGEKNYLAIPGRNLPWYGGKHNKITHGQVAFEDAPFGSHIDLLTEDGLSGVNPSKINNSFIFSPESGGYIRKNVISPQDKPSTISWEEVVKSPQTTTRSAQLLMGEIVPSSSLGNATNAAGDINNFKSDSFNDFFKQAKINAFLNGDPYFKADFGPHGIHREPFPSDWTITKMPFSDKSKEIMTNTAKPRILAQAEKDIRSMYDPTIDGPDIEKYVKEELSNVENQLDEKIKQGYDLGSEELFKFYDTGKTSTYTGGLQRGDNGQIVLRDGQDPERFAVHEWEHRRTNRNIKGEYYGTEKRLLRKAFTKEFRELSETVSDFKGMKMDNEMVTTNSDARAVLLGEEHLRKTSPELQNKIIDASSDEKIFDAVKKSNAYGYYYMKLMEESGKLTHELAQNIREALKHVGGYAAPIGIGLTGYGLYNSVTDPINLSYNKGKDPIRIKPSKRGTFTAAAKKRGMGVLLFASKVLKNPSNYSSAMRKKALFAKNATKFKH